MNSLDRPESPSPTRYYSVLILTSGLFTFYWLLSLMRQVNGLQKHERVFNTSIAAALYIAVNAAYLVGVLMIMRSGPTSVPVSTAILMAVAWLATILASVAWIDIEVMRLETGKVRAGGVVRMVLLTLFIFLSLPRLQEKINAIVQRRRIDAPA